MKITVIDRICGDGKSQGMMDIIRRSANNLLSGDKFLYITPYLEQCHSIAGTEPTSAVDERPKTDRQGKIIYKCTEHNLGCIKMKHPDQSNSEGTKQESLRILMNNDQNIISTHNLFLNMKLDTLCNADKYTLVIDESLDVFDKCSVITTKHAKKLIKLKILELREDGITLDFNRHNFGVMLDLSDDEDVVEDTNYEELAVLCDNKQLLLVNDDVLIWEFSAEILKKFKKVYILSYLFEGREMSVYLKKHGIEYEIIKGSKGGKDVAHLVEILDDSKLNSVGDDLFALSISKTKEKLIRRTLPDRSKYDCDEKYKKALKRYESWLSGVNSKEVSSKDTNDILRRNLHSVFSTRWKAKAGDRFFTCLAENKNFIAGKNYKKDWLSFSIKATNLYMETHHVAFLMNVFMQPTIKKVCDSTEYQVDEDLVSLSHLIQFVFRSALRKGEKIKVYIPSSRMRGLFKDYLEGVYD